MKTLLGSVSLVALVSVTPAFAIDNTNWVTQDGTANQAGIIQLGATNYNETTQRGTGNFDWTLQASNGGSNSKIVTQDGILNSIVAIQLAAHGGSNVITGSDPLKGATQTGFGNTADIWQVAYGSGASNKVQSDQSSSTASGASGQHLNVLQVATAGSSNTMHNYQIDGSPSSGAPPNNETANALQLAINGGSNFLQNAQYGQNDISNTLQVADHGSNDGYITQDVFSDGAKAELAQFASGGGSNYGSIYQGGPAGSGDGNTAGLLQVAGNGGTNTGWIYQYGSANDATTVQFAASGGSNFSSIGQYGYGNEAKIYQNTDTYAHEAQVHYLVDQAYTAAYSRAYAPYAPSLDMSGLKVNVAGYINLTPVVVAHNTTVTVPGTFNLNKR